MLAEVLGDARVLDRIGLTSEGPLAIATCDPAGRVKEAVEGTWPSGQPVRTSDRFYVASLAKQVTGAAAALLVKRRQLDPDLPVHDYLPALPAWSEGVSVRHLVHHLAGLPAAGMIEPTEEDWTDELALAALTGLDHLMCEPGAAYLYSNLGYVLLAHVIGKAAGVSFKAFVSSEIFGPLGLAEMEFTATGVVDFAQAASMGRSLPLTMGDGGLWATARDYSKWLFHQNVDALGVADLVITPGRLNDGSPIDYGWGLGLRTRNGEPLYSHGGEWRPGATARAIRSPSQGIAVVAMSSTASMAQLDLLIDAAIAANAVLPH